MTNTELLQALACSVLLADCGALQVGPQATVSPQADIRNLH